MVYSVKGFRCIEKTSIYRTIIIIVITYNKFNCINTVECFCLKPNWLSLVNKYASIIQDKHNSNIFDIAVTIAMGL